MHIRCSGLHRPMKCAGYAFLELPKSPSNPAAEEGTAAGEYLEKLLTGAPMGPCSSKGFFINDDIKFYIDPIFEDIKQRAASEVFCEQKINWVTVSGIWIKGQPDIAFVDHQGRLCVEDLKYGWGIVEVEENWQLLGYAIGEVLRRGQAFNEISLKIHQPRPHHKDGSTREWVLQYSDLLAYKQQIEDRMMELANGRREFQTGPHCKYCRGAAEACTAFNKLFYDSIEVSTEFNQDNIDNDELSRQLGHIERAAEVLKIKKDSLMELATIRIKDGGLVPGYVHTTRYGNRAWKPGISPDTVEMITGHKATETNFMSPAKIQKLGVHRDIINTLAEKKFLGYKLEKKDTTKLGNEIFGTTNPNGGN